MSSRERMTKVLGCLVLSVTAGAIFLRMLQPAPLVEITAFSLSAAFNPIQQIFQTRVPVKVESWQQIVIHQSGASKGNAGSLVESRGQYGSGGSPYHFVINNGKGAPDGRIQVSPLWTEQKNGRGLPVGSVSSAGGVIRVCLIGDFSRWAPGGSQMSQLQALVRILQERCRIPAGRISLASRTALGPGQWRKFPLDELRKNVLAYSEN